MTHLRCRQNKLPLLYYQFNHNHNHDYYCYCCCCTKQTCIQMLPGSSISWLTVMTDFRGFCQLFYRNSNVTPSNRPEMPCSKSLLSQYSWHSLHFTEYAALNLCCWNTIIKQSMNQSLSAIILVSLLFLKTRSTQTGSRINMHYSHMLSTI